jgi:uncharacterized membrane protein YhaH (DUF805 family)
MPEQLDLKGKLRSECRFRKLGRAKYSLYGGAPGVIIRAVLVTLLMFLLVTARKLMANNEVAFVSVLFLLALFTPVLTHKIMRLVKAHKITGGN